MTWTGVGLPRTCAAERAAGGSFCRTTLAHGRFGRFSGRFKQPAPWPRSPVAARRPHGGYASRGSGGSCRPALRGEAGFSGPNSSRLTMTMGHRDRAAAGASAIADSSSTRLFLASSFGSVEVFGALHPLNGPALLAQQQAQSLVADNRRPPPWRPGARPASAGSSVESGSPWSVGRPRATLVISARWSALKVAGRPPR